MKVIFICEVKRGKINYAELDKIIINKDSLLAHIKKNKSGEVVKTETLDEHLGLTRSYLGRLFSEKGMEVIVDRIINDLQCEGQKLPEEMKRLAKELIVNAVYLHDIGKINPYFQRRQMSNPYFLDIKGNGNDKHALLSAWIYLDLFEARINEVQNKRLKYYFYNLLYSFAFLISRHHTYLKDLEMDDFLTELINLNEELQDDKYDFLRCYQGNDQNRDFGKNNHFRKKTLQYANWKMDDIAFYILNKLLFSLIVTTDYYATYQFFNDDEIDLGLLNDIDRVMDVYSRYSVCQGITAYKSRQEDFSKQPINRLRCEMFIEAEENLLRNLDKHIFYLEAPTGGGKTNTSVNLALQILKHDHSYQKIFYIFPFNTLVEQTKNVFQDIFGNQLRYAVVNSITPMVTIDEKAIEDGKESETGVDYERSYIDRQFLHYPVVLTTHINLFNWLFGGGREANFPLAHLCNSVVILDEIQSYRNYIWNEIILFLNKYAKILNMKIIIMSATLPRLDELLPEAEKSRIYQNLIYDSYNYYKNGLFKNRVKLHFELLSEKITLEKLESEVFQCIKKRQRSAKVLIEFIKKGTARKFFNQIKNQGNQKGIVVVELSGDDNQYIRKSILKQIKDTETIIVVATQVIEAGINIDMDIGFKNISILDSEEQFLGRINRSCLKKDCHACFFNLDDARDVYRKDFRVNYSILNETYRRFLVKKDFTGFYKCCMDELRLEKEKFNKNNLDVIKREALELQFAKIQEKMKLITERSIQIYLPYRIFINGIKLDGFKLWEDYKTLSSYKTHEMDYAEKKVKLSKLNEQMTFFTYNLVIHRYTQDELPYAERFGNYYYIQNAEEFLTEDHKFDREKYQSCIGGLFL